MGYKPIALGIISKITELAVAMIEESDLQSFKQTKSINDIK